MGSLERKITSCFYSIRAEMPPYGAQELLDLELFLAWGGAGSADRDTGRAAIAIKTYFRNLKNNNQPPMNADRKSETQSYRAHREK